MPTVKDVVVKKPSDAETKKCKSWPIWKCEPSNFDWAYTEKETCLILEGKVTVSDDSGSVTFGPGDLVIFPNGLECTWRVTEAVSKHYNFG
ncbi:MAG: cupin domain-containing protein [Sedimentisphaerales bacterium]|nr:cupin domain-containing protein [Sedimentisphaerales bacterium]